ncbi:hypothetical protein ERJ70_18790 [Sediminibacillus dalangtanensis]|uniref:Recombinase domain-containing protein n=1 Tax=Sediminibacillus dalangtanensis TaxID=2729421 RepID=A0ABX7VW00_9BACI|nr:recombinase family protein [Sediminibacillus dalangtanensis]QTN01148.1 hypothetical protein ERJ70_18790 [Sediminibacillus dalangtanensis]
MQVNNKQAEVVRELFKLRKEFPRWSLSDLAEALNDKGYTTRQNKKFTKVQVKRILDKKDFYKGFYKYGQVTSTGQHVSILDTTRGEKIGRQKKYSCNTDRNRSEKK